MKYAGDKTKEISFPLGGIGTGSIGLAGNGRFVDWEIFNRPSKGSMNMSHFAVRAAKKNKAVTMTLNGDMKKDYTGTRGVCYGHGPTEGTLCGFPHFKNVEFTGDFPVGELTFSDEEFPGKVKMTAFNPFIPNDADNSSIPAAFFEIEIANDCDEETEYRVAFLVHNPFQTSKNKIETVDGMRILRLYNSGVDKEDVNYGDLAVASDAETLTIQECCFRGGWKDYIVTYWNEMSSKEGFSERSYDTDGCCDCGVVSATASIKPGATQKIRFVLTWNVPNCYNYWSEYKDENGKDITWKNYYATIYKNSAESAIYCIKNWDDLYGRTLKFKNILHGSTLPESVKDAVSANLSVLKSPTVLRLEDGTFYGWEGLSEHTGVCEGTCQHVWNYAYALCFLFPELERSIRNAEFKYSTASDGRMPFRLTLPLGREMSDWRACLDGQMGSVIKCYREWKLSGDNEWLKDNWDNIKKALEYAWSESNYDEWDRNKDGVLEGRQHHTLDVELFGPSSWLEGMYLAALKAGAEMAEFLGETDKAAEYSDLFEKGKKWTAENLFNGKYFIQKIDITDKALVEHFGASDTYWNDEAGEIKYQIGEGSSIDQMLAQWHCDIIGLGDVFYSEQICAALDEMFKMNYKQSMRYHANPWRTFSFNDEAGSVICEYPDLDKKPKIPICYCEETMTGFEYAFAGLLMSRGKLDEGFTVAKAVRDRFDGEKRNPWNEFECGSNYARSMASYAFVPILSGFSFDLPKAYIGFKPYMKDSFRCIWSVDGAWGEFSIADKKAVLRVAEGSIKLRAFGAEFAEKATNLKLDGKMCESEFKNGCLCFEEAVVGESLEFEI